MPSLENTSRNLRKPIVILAVVILTIQVVIDIILGADAEYFNAWATLVRLTYPLHLQTIDAPMIHAQDALGVFALPVATLVMIGGPLLAASLVLGGWRLIRQRHLSQ